MSGSGVDKRARALAVQIAKLRREGMTNRQIAETVGIDVKRIPSKVEIGDRILSLTEKKWP